jgi:hypothetical protein
MGPLPKAFRGVVIDYQHFRLTATRDDALPPEKCVEVEADGVTLAVDLARSDLLIEAEIRRFAEQLDRPGTNGRRYYRVTPESLGGGRDCGRSLQQLETWFQQRSGHSLPAAAKLLFSGSQLAPYELRRLTVLHVPTAEMADGLQQWPGTRALIATRLGPTALAVAEEHVDMLRERLATLGVSLRSLMVALVWLACTVWKIGFDSGVLSWHKPRRIWQIRRKHVATTLAELEERLQALEAEMASLRELIQGYAPTERHTRRLREDKANPAALEVSHTAVYQKMGISGEAPGMQQLRALLAAHGVHPGDEIVRQEIAAMRQQEENE